MQNRQRRTQPTEQSAHVCLRCAGPRRCACRLSRLREPGERFPPLPHAPLAGAPFPILRRAASRISVEIGHRDTVRFRKIVCRPSNAVSRIIQRGDAVALAHPLSIQWRRRWRLRWLDRGDDSAPDTHDVVAVVTAQKDLRHVATALRTVDFHAVLFRFTENRGAPQRDSHGLGGHVWCRKRCPVLNTQICGHSRVMQAMDACRP